MNPLRKLALALAALIFLSAFSYAAFASGISVGGVTVAETPSEKASPEVSPAAAPESEPKYAEYLKSTSEIAFPEGGSVAEKAASLCKDKKSDKQKALAIYNYIAANFTYDTGFADAVRAGRITVYTPDTASILSNKKGVCYDFSALFAAMCRSQGIPAKLCKGYSTRVGGYHAWNAVYLAEDDAWYTLARQSPFPKLPWTAANTRQHPQHNRLAETQRQLRRSCLQHIEKVAAATFSTR